MRSIKNSYVGSDIWDDSDKIDYLHLNAREEIGGFKMQFHVRLFFLGERKHCYMQMAFDFLPFSLP